MTPPFLESARPLALAAAERITALRLSPLQKSKKADHSLVTNADHAANAIITEGLRRAFPDHAILSEEEPFAGAGAAEYVWVIDPLDGTRAYARGDAGFSVMVGLLHKGRPFAGIVVDPTEGILYEAVRGAGAYAVSGGERRRLRVSNRRNWAAMPVITSAGFPEAWKKRLERRFTGRWVAPVNSVGVKIGYVTREIADLYVNHHYVHLWDTCAPEIILEEAGGRITYLDGRPLEYPLAGSHRHPGLTLATNGTRHDDALAILADLVPPPAE